MLLALAGIVLWFLLADQQHKLHYRKRQIVFVPPAWSRWRLVCSPDISNRGLPQRGKAEKEHSACCSSPTARAMMCSRQADRHLLHAAYGLLAIFPILALPLLMGGVTAGEFWQGDACAGHNLFSIVIAGHRRFSVSQETRDRQLAGTLLASWCLRDCCPWLWWLRCWVAGNALWSGLLWPSPGFLSRARFATCFTYKTGAHEFWASFATISAIGIGSLLEQYVPAARLAHRSENQAETPREPGQAVAVWLAAARLLPVLAARTEPVLLAADRDKLPRYITAGQ